jgi:hypothetical protein
MFNYAQQLSSNNFVLVNSGKHLTYFELLKEKIWKKLTFVWVLETFIYLQKNIDLMKLKW